LATHKLFVTPIQNLSWQSLADVTADTSDRSRVGINADALIRSGIVEKSLGLRSFIEHCVCWQSLADVTADASGLNHMIAHANACQQGRERLTSFDMKQRHETAHQDFSVWNHTVNHN